MIRAFGGIGLSKYIKKNKENRLVILNYTDSSAISADDVLIIRRSRGWNFGLSWEETLLRDKQIQNKKLLWKYWQ